MPDFILDPRLEADSIPVATLALCAVRLTIDANYPWLLVVPCRAGLVELLDLAEDERARLIEEIALAGAALRSEVACDKLNVAAIGNVVAQLHVHVIARRRGDPAWPRPVWGAVPAKAYPPGEAEALAARLAARLK
jgi:diadenosine tetraphosphate (Ap4A) HIT family hydrolase